MSFIQLHQKKKPILVAINIIKQVHQAAKGNGSFIVTNLEGHDMEVDESQDKIIEYLTELQIEVTLFANDDQ